MLFGMGFVFAFLVLLIISSKLMSATVARLIPTSPPPPAATSARGSDVEADTLAAIRIAIQRHRALRH